MAQTDLGFIHRFEPAAEAGAPTLLLLHGTGGNENDLIDLGRMLAPGSGLLSPRGKVLENGMPRFFRRLAEGVFDIEDLKLRTHELADFVDKAVDAYGLDPSRITAMGFSNGANIAAGMLLLRPGVVRSAVLLRAMVPLEPEIAPDLAGSRVLIASGRFDPIVPVENAERLAEMLRTAGAQVNHHWEEAAHGLMQGDIEVAREWLRDF
jgi:phospholipase/carboxylesterase